MKAEESMPEVEHTAAKLAKVLSLEVELESRLQGSLRAFYLGKNLGFTALSILALGGVVFAVIYFAVSSDRLMLSLLLLILVFELMRVNEKVTVLEKFYSVREERKFLEERLRSLNSEVTQSEIPVAL